MENQKGVKPAASDTQRASGDYQAGELDGPSISQSHWQIQEPPRRSQHRKTGGLTGLEERYRLTRPSARRLVEQIKAHWSAMGIDAHVWTEPCDEDAAAVEWAVRSNLKLTWVKP